jgi:hypothetical protein
MNSRIGTYEKSLKILLPNSIADPIFERMAANPWYTKQGKKTHIIQHQLVLIHVIRVPENFELAFNFCSFTAASPISAEYA